MGYSILLLLNFVVGQSEKFIDCLNNLWQNHSLYYNTVQWTGYPVAITNFVHISWNYCNYWAAYVTMGFKYNISSVIEI